MTVPAHNYATFKRDGYDIPLIGIPAEDVLIECSLCHDQFRQETMMMSPKGGQMLCAKCQTMKEHESR